VGTQLLPANTSDDQAVDGTITLQRVHAMALWYGAQWAVATITPASDAKDFATASVALEDVIVSSNAATMTLSADLVETAREGLLMLWRDVAQADVAIHRQVVPVDDDDACAALPLPTARAEYVPYLEENEADYPIILHPTDEVKHATNLVVTSLNPAVTGGF
jgi:hypothetical protein